MKDCIILIGMPGAGKSTVGVLLAKSLLKSFIDTDLIIQSSYGCSLCDIIEKEGTDTFLKIENDVISSGQYTNAVIATGGSAVYGEKAMAHLKASGTVIYLQLPLEEIYKRTGDIRTRGVAMKNGDTLAALYKERVPLYEAHSDFTVDCQGLTAEECVDRIVEVVRNQTPLQ